MKCYLVRHGKDDDSVRGGWSAAPLTEQGIEQIKALASNLASNREMNVVRIFSSDLFRAKQTAEIISNELNIPVEYLPQFREVNNGVLAGMRNTDALKKFPGLFWSALDWNECYPEGESPCAFYNRVWNAWHEFTNTIHNQDGDVILITHGGVINIILYIINGLKYSNKTKPFYIKHAELISVEL